MQRIRRALDEVEIRLLGSLLEKQKTTPEYYPLSLNALAAAANQKSNREPAMEISDVEITGALDRLQEMNLVWKVLGNRAIKWEQNIEKKWELDAPMRGLLTLFFLRGPQTTGELRARSERLHDFASLEEVESALRRMRDDSDPYVIELPRRQGQKEVRWMHLFGEIEPETLAAAAGPAVASAPAALPRGSLEARVQSLEIRTDEISVTLKKLLERLGE